MASFIQAEFSTEHAGVARFERGVGHIARAVRTFDGARGAATLLLAALVSAMLVVANQVIDRWSEGRLLAAWIVLWLVGVAALALFAAPARAAAAALRRGFAAWRQARREAREDAQLWAIALTDARVMADLSRGMSSNAARRVRAYY